MSRVGKYMYLNRLLTFINACILPLNGKNVRGLLIQTDSPQFLGA